MSIRYQLQYNETDAVSVLKIFDNENYFSAQTSTNVWATHVELEPSVSTSTEDMCVSVLQEPEVIHIWTVAPWTSVETTLADWMPNATMKDPRTDVNALKDSKETQHNNV